MIRTLIMMFLVCTLNAQVTWNTIDEGFEIGTYVSPKPSSIGNSTMTILRVDPKLYDFDIKHEYYGNTADVWSKKHNLLAVVNAGMYDRNGMNMGAMKNFDSIYNPKLNKDNAILAFNPKSKGLPLVDIIDTKYVDAERLLKEYNSYTQSIRMVSLSGNNLWAPRNLMWSVLVVAMDKQGKVLFIHCRSPYPMHTFIDIVLQSPLNVRNMMYLEGGPEASLYVNNCGTELSLMGSYETNFFDDSNYHFWRIPNIIGITKK